MGKEADRREHQDTICVGELPGTCVAVRHDCWHLAALLKVWSTQVWAGRGFHVLSPSSSMERPEAELSMKVSLLKRCTLCFCLSKLELWLSLAAMSG